MEEERQILLDELSRWTNDYLLKILKNVVLYNPKSAEASEQARKRGNALYLQKKKHNALTHKAIFSLYCESIALAPVNSQELAFAYGNRSCLLLHMHKYEDCIKDIDRALNLTNSDALIVKLLCRKVECLKSLGSSDDISSILESIQYHIDKIEGQDRINLLRTIDAVKALVVGNAKALEMSSVEEKQRTDLPLTDDYSERISIQCSLKYGRHLVAAQDYKPGDIIFVEKMYATAFMEGSSLSACDYCLIPIWSSIPCDYCNWSMYCSEACKEKAWNKYHDIECSLISHFKQCCESRWTTSIMPIRILITGIKETGSIANLKREIQLLDQCAGNVLSKTFFNGPFALNSIQNVYSLASYAPDESLETECVVIPLILYSLTKHSNLKDNFNVKRIEDLAMNEDVVFLGSLLIKIMSVMSANGFGFNYNRFNVLNQTYKQWDVHVDGTRCLSTLFSLLNHSCFPNAEWRCIEKKKLFVYALRPIKKDSQIFINYGYSFESDTDSMRRIEIFEKYNFMCDCQACVEDWLPLFKDGELDQEKLEVDRAINFLNGTNSVENVIEVKKVLEEGRPIDKSHIEKLSSVITQCINWKHPSPVFCSMTNIFKELFTVMYSPKALVFEKCD